MPQEKRQRHDKLFFASVLFMSGIYKNYKLQFHGRFEIKELVVYHLIKEILGDWIIFFSVDKGYKNFLSKG